MQEDCINLALYLNGAQEKKINNDNNNNNKCTDIEKSAITPGSEEWVNLGLYTSRKDLLQMISTECIYSLLFTFFLYFYRENVSLEKDSRGGKIGFRVMIKFHDCSPCKVT